MNAALLYGMKLVLHQRSIALAVLRGIQEHRATMFEGVPTMYMVMLAHPGPRTVTISSSLTRCTVGGQTMPVAKMQEVEKHGSAAR